jgi:hypothetical protein
MHVKTDRSVWRIEYQGEPDQTGRFRLYHLPSGSTDFKEYPEILPGDPVGMQRLIDVIEDSDAVTLGGDMHTWRIHFEANEELGCSAWTLPWHPTDADLMDRLLDELERGEL